MKTVVDDCHFPRIALLETDSTSRYLQVLCQERRSDVAELTTVTAEYQTAGRGQRGNSWESEREKNLLWSTVLYPTRVEARRQFVVSQAVALSIKEELDTWAEGMSIKWPNDIYYLDRKIAGILIENDLEGQHIGRCIVGVGLNVNQTHWQSDAPNPVSLCQITGREHDRDLLLTGIMRRLIAYCRSLRTEPMNEAVGRIATRYARSLYRRRGLHPYKDAHGPFMARLLRVEADGRLVLEDDAGRERGYLFKEVQYVIQ